MRRVILPLAVIALAGCHKTEPAKAPAPSTAPAVVQMPAPVPAPAGRAPGLWKMTLTTDGEALVETACVDAASEALWSPVAVDYAAGQCDPAQVSPAPGGFSLTRACRTAHGPVTYAGEARGDLATRYDLSGKAGGAAFRTQGERLGDCPAGWRGGDVSVAGGPRANVIHPKAE